MRKLPIFVTLAILASTSTLYAQVLEPQQYGDATYITGGIGDEERDLLEQVKGDYNLRIMSALNDGAFTGDTRITIRTLKGEEVLSADAGPIFLAKLLPGRYKVEAASENQTRSQNITIGNKGYAHIHFSWK